ncbi:hypothetical protein CSKR_106135 [Clonorchis sinensis]|uniref:Arrestin-like N-terminal domain-containing protein n=1 Tax=Clonorchis sinensis TaxID=79923 RepID=A0A419PJL5_CLOSI|nr:hypothetical protein CSKR_106135 [Clonorchis sinensis]
MVEREANGKSQHALQLHLHLNRDKPQIYRSGEVITGRLELNCAHILSVKVLLVELLGRVVVVAPCSHKSKIPWWWTSERKALQRKFFSHQNAGYIVSLPSKCNQSKCPKSLEVEGLRRNPPVSIRHHNPKFRVVNEEIVCYQITTLLGGNTPGSCEAVFPGEHAFPFLFHLPETCPCSFTGTRGSVEYRLKVTLHLSNGDVYRSIKGFVVIRDVVIGEQLDIPSTLSCPPISRWFVSGFDLLSHSGAVDELTTLIRQRLRSNRFDEFGSCVIDGDRQCPPESFDPMLRWEAAETQQPNTSLLQVDGNFGQLRINQNRDLFSKRQPERLKDRLRRALTGNKYAGLQMSRATPPLHYSQCYNMSSLVPTSWISRPHTSEVTSYPRVAMGSQIGYAVSCRLTVSRRNMVPGERITTRLTLFVEDPFALVPLPKLTEDQCNRGSCTPFCCASFRQTKRVWSPLAKAFVSYFLEESYEQQLSDPYESSAIWWKGVVKQPHRIMVVLRQMTTYNDWTNHVIAEEERDIYMGEMERGQPTDKHLLRVSLEHVFNVPAVAPSNLDGTHCITVSYLLGVVHFKLKKYEHLWLPNEWRVHLNRCVKNAALRDIERMYIPYSSDVEPKSVRWSKRFVRQMQRKKRSSPATWKRIYSDLLLPIPIHIGTSKYGPSPGGDQDGLLIANDALYPCYYMQWPYSCEHGSLPPAYAFVSHDREKSRNSLQANNGLQHSVSFADINATRRSTTAERRRRSHSSGGRLSFVPGGPGPGRIRLSSEMRRNVDNPVHRKRRASEQLVHSQHATLGTDARSTWQPEVQI